MHRPSPRSEAEGEPRASGAPTGPQRPTPIARLLRSIEWLGDRLPHPVTLFALFTALVLLISAVGAALGWSVPDPRPMGARGRTEDGVIRIVSLLDAEGLRWLTTSLVSNFVGFVPLGTVLVSLLGVGVCERSGLLSAGMRGVVLAAPRHLVTPAVIFAGVMSNAASEMGFVVLIPLAAALYHALGRHPLAGLAAAFAGVSGGYSANLVLGTVDPLLSGITQEAAQLVAPGTTVHAAANWWFMAGSTFLVTGLGWLVSARIVEPRLGPYDPAGADPDVPRESSLEPLTPLERRATRWAFASSLVVAVLLAHLAGFGVRGLPGYGILGVPVGGSLRDAALLKGIVAVIFVFFLVPGVVYGRITGTLKSDRDVIDAMAGAMSTMGLYIVLVFFAAQFVACFERCHLGAFLAVLGSDGLVALRLDGPLVFVPFIVLCGGVNMLIGSASAKWAVTAPIFVPMLMGVGFSPEVIQAAYRIGDSTTNLVTPMMPYFGLILAFVARYDRRVGLGTLIGMMLPYSALFIVAWTAFFFVWVFALGVPVGPDAATYLPGFGGQ